MFSHNCVKIPLFELDQHWSSGIQQNVEVHGLLRPYKLVFLIKHSTEQICKMKYNMTSCLANSTVREISTTIMEHRILIR